jgi:hypothetical protein
MPSQGTYTQNAGTLTAALGAIAGGASATLRVLVQPQMTGSMISIGGEILANQFLADPNQGMTSIPVDVSPAAPTNVTASVQIALGGPRVLEVQWAYTNPPGSAATFNIYRSETPGGEGTTPYATGVTADQYTDTAAVPGHVYYYQVTAAAGPLESLHSGEALGTILTAPAITSTDVVSSDDGSTVATLHWSYPASVGAAVTFNVYRSTTPGGEGAAPFQTGVGEDLTQMNAFAGALAVNSLPGSTYFYQVSAVVAGREGPRSSEAKATAPGLVAPSLVMVGSAVPLMVGLQGGLDDVTLVWSDAYIGARSVSFNLYAATTSGGEGATPYEQAVGYNPTTEPSGAGGLGGGGGASSFGGSSGPDFDAAHVTQPIGTTYYQIVEVVQVNGTLVSSPRSNEVAVTVPGPPVAASHLVRIHLQIPTVGFRRTATDVVLEFSSGLNPADAQNLAAYHLVTLGKLNKKTGQHATRPVKLTSAVYNPASDTVTLAIKGKLPNQPVELSVNTAAVRDASGQPIAGSSGQAGGTFEATFGKKGINLASVTAAGIAGRHTIR